MRLTLRPKRTTRGSSDDTSEGQRTPACFSTRKLRWGGSCRKCSGTGLPGVERGRRARSERVDAVQHGGEARDTTRTSTREAGGEIYLQWPLSLRKDDALLMCDGAGPSAALPLPTSKGGTSLLGQAAGVEVVAEPGGCSRRRSVYTSLYVRTSTAALPRSYSTRAMAGSVLGEDTANDAVR